MPPKVKQIIRKKIIKTLLKKTEIPVQLELKGKRGKVAV